MIINWVIQEFNFLIVYCLEDQSDWKGQRFSTIDGETRGSHSCLSMYKSQSWEQSCTLFQDKAELLMSRERTPWLEKFASLNEWLFLVFRLFVLFWNVCWLRKMYLPTVPKKCTKSILSSLVSGPSEAPCCKTRCVYSWFAKPALPGRDCYHVWPLCSCYVTYVCPPCPALP